MAQVHEFDMAMTCDGCANAAKRVLGKLGDDVTLVETDVEAKKVFVTSTLPFEKLLEALKKTGKEINYVGVKN
ncbi:metal homeostasis factor ATX1-like [Lingula anatina]|uniref:Copper transport protein ATOX1 n=1 Tax=Lingula anatina TaxID=7574 RepID=A0A1S3HMF5_LINAN|nr:metal homeostasis factor ATX1-like [Lingula anatina]|eukprot:XP_013386219.1 metal homeostasis factor ATX1-like [Lingula anatina]